MDPRKIIAGVALGLLILWVGSGLRVRDVAPIDSVDNSNPGCPAPEALWKPTITQVDNLIADLGSDDEYKARSAGIKLGQVAEPPLDRVLEVFRGPDDGAVIAAAYALAGIGRPAVPHLIAALKNDDAVAVAAAANALNAIGKRDLTAITGATEPLMIAVRRHSLEVKDVPRVADGYGSTAEYAARNAQIARVENSAKAVAGSLRALGTLGEPRALGMIIRSLDSHNRVVGLAAVEAVGAYGSVAVAPLIAAWHQGEAHTEWGVAALEATKDPRAVDLLIAALPGKLGWRAAQALGTIGDQRAAEPLVALLKQDPVAGRRSARPWAIDSLGKLKYAPAVPALVKALDDPNTAVQRAAAEALGAIGDKSAVMPLIAVVQRKREPEPKREDTNLVIAAAESLGKLGDDRAFEPLVALLVYGESRIHVAAIEALGTMGGARAIEPLMGMMRRGNSAETNSAKQALRGIGAPAAPAMVAALADDEMSGAMEYALRDMGADALDALIAGLEAPDCSTQKQLVKLLRALADGHPRAQEAIDRAEAKAAANDG